MNLEELAYDEMKGSFAEQAATLDGYRSRAGQLVAAGALVASFIGAAVITSSTWTAGGSSPR